MTGPVSDLPALPPEAPLEMPEQDFGARPDRAWPRRFERPGTWMARLIAFGGTATAAWIGFQQMLITFGDNPTPMQIALLILFVPQLSDLFDTLRTAVFDAVFSGLGNAVYGLLQLTGVM